jgi:hypothetical protein
MSRLLGPQMLNPTVWKQHPRRTAFQPYLPPHNTEGTERVSLSLPGFSTPSLPKWAWTKVGSGQRQWQHGSLDGQVSGTSLSLLGDEGGLATRIGLGNLKLPATLSIIYSSVYQYLVIHITPPQFSPSTPTTHPR